jgi:diacylglycerol kinase family enzyme
MGTPAKVVKTANSWRKNKMNAVLYYKNALAYAKGDHRAWSAPGFFKDLDKTLGSALEF